MYEKWKSRYDKGWATDFQLQRLVVLGVLTQTQYEDITGEVYPV